MIYDVTQKTIYNILTNNDMEVHFMNGLNDKKSAWNWKKKLLWKMWQVCLSVVWRHNTSWNYEMALSKSKSYILKIAVYFEWIIKIIWFFAYLLLHLTKYNGNFSVNHLVHELFWQPSYSQNVLLWSRACIFQ